MTRRTQILHEATLWTTLLSIIGVVFAAFFFMDARHASDQKVNGVEVRMRQTVLDTDINRNAKIKHHYDQIEMERELSKSEQNRKRYVEDELDRQYAEQSRLRELQDALETQQ